MSVWSFSIPEPEPAAALCYSKHDDDSHSIEPQAHSTGCAPGDAGSTAAAPTDAATGATQRLSPENRGSSPPEVHRVYSKNTIPGKKNEVDAWFNHQAFEKPPQPSHSPPVNEDSRTESHSGKQEDSPAQASERKQANNREHQRRWRLRQKARNQAVQKQLATAAAELKELKARQQQLEAKSQLPDTSPSLKREQATAFVSEGSPDGEPFVPFDDLDMHNQPIMTISIGGRRQTATAEQVRSLTLQQFAALWTVYNSELRHCLVHLSKTADEDVERSMHQLALEALRLLGCRLLLNPSAHKHLITGRMYHGHEAQHVLDHTFYVNLLILLALSGNQINDCMLLRRLYHSKRGLLRIERRELVNQMASAEDEAPHPCEHVVTVSDLSTCLKDNAAENHQILYRVARALYRGVLTTRQLAEVEVHSYPYMPMMETMLDTIASQLGYPSQEQIMASAHLDPMAAEWQLFGSYAKFIGSQHSHGYIQLCQQVNHQETVTSALPAVYTEYSQYASFDGNAV